MSSLIFVASEIGDDEPFPSNGYTYYNIIERAYGIVSAAEAI
jgi:hypothetical protein